MSYNYITDSHTNAIHKTTSPEGAKLIQRYMNQIGGSTATDRPRHSVTTELWTTSEWAKPAFLRKARGKVDPAWSQPISLAAMHYRLTQAWLSVLDPAGGYELGLHVNKRLARLDVTEGLLNELPLENYNYGDISTEQQSKIGIIIKKIAHFSTENAGEIEPLDETVENGSAAAFDAASILANQFRHQFERIRSGNGGLERAADLENDWRREVFRRTYEPLKVFKDAVKARRMEERGRKQAVVAKRKRAAKVALKAAAVAKSAAEVVVLAALDKEFGPNMQAYKTVHDLTTSRTLARLDSLILAVRNSSLSDPFSKLGSPDFRPESPPIDVGTDEDFDALISQADQSLMP